MIQKAQDEGSPLHGTYAFDKFLEMKGYRKPEERAVPKFLSFGHLIKKAETPQKNNGEKEEPRFPSENLKKLQEDKIKQFKKALHLPPIRSDMKIPHPSYLNF
ncbi:hypothetical protein JRQ81_016979 [Phrynocephalus forsythii]|uniref:Uncharacterized protein n=1 Tax=Phrynocephalus forsythii TaxID=171643 RepID=A0A9Q0XT92_9SAUR|nr:hypothetical protein JRQ81_016979 [Phrynocephalus forsythii]